MRNSRDLVLGEVVYIAIISHIPDSWINLSNNYDFLVLITWLMKTENTQNRSTELHQNFHILSVSKCTHIMCSWIHVSIAFPIALISNFRSIEFFHFLQFIYNGGANQGVVCRYLKPQKSVITTSDVEWIIDEKKGWSACSEVCARGIKATFVFYHSFS